MKKSNFQTVIYALIFATTNAHTYKLFKNIFNDVQTKERYIRHNLSTLKLHFDTISVDGGDICFFVEKQF